MDRRGPAKIERDLGKSLNVSWSNLEKLPHGSFRREIMFLLIHNKLPTKERLFRIGLEQDPYCSFCFDDLGVAVMDDLEHFFCACGRIASLWDDVKHCIENLVPSSSMPIRDFDLITLNFSNRSCGREMSWLLSWYVSEQWCMKKRNSVELQSRAKFFGFLQF